MARFENGSAYIEYKTDLNIERDLMYRHMHDNVELHFIVHGKGNLRIEESMFELHNYDLFIMPSHVYHYVEIDKSEKYERIIINIPTNLYSCLEYEDLFSSPRVVNLASHNELLKIFENIIYYNTHIQNEKDKNIMMFLLAEQIIILLKNTQFDTTVSKSVNELTSKIIDYIDEHIYEALTVEKIANSLYVSKSHLQNTFLTSMKIGVKAYIIMKKMNIAHSMLQDGKRSIIVAQSLGYTTYSSFFKSYVKVFGVPPKDTK